MIDTLMVWKDLTLHVYFIIEILSHNLDLIITFNNNFNQNSKPNPVQSFLETVTTDLFLKQNRMQKVS